MNSTTLMELLLIVRLSLNLRRTFVIDWCFDNPEKKLSLLQHLKDTSSVQGADTGNTPSRGFIKHWYNKIPSSVLDFVIKINCNFDNCPYCYNCETHGWSLEPFRHRKVLREKLKKFLLGVWTKSSSHVETSNPNVFYSRTSSNVTKVTFWQSYHYGFVVNLVYALAV